MTALRLEALRHPSMTGGGLARSDSGNFVLTQITLALQRKGGQVAQPIKIGSAVASYEQGGFKVEGAFDENPGTGWAVYEGRTVDRDHEAVFRLAESFDAAEDQELVVSLRHDSPHRSHNLGHFRISVTALPNADLAGVGDKLAKALQTPEAQRSGDQKNEILEAFRRTDALYQELAEQLARVETQRDDLRKQIPRVMVLADRAERRQSNVLKMGLYNAKLDPVEADLPAQFAHLPEGAPKNRLSLAKWLVDPSNPLTSRVVVNREWQRFFGVGLVKTAEDFGSQGDKPSHPGLFDWLALRFMDGWDVKALHRLILTSATYRQSAKATAERINQDPENRLLSRGVRYRLPSWMIRDQALAIAGLLVEKRGGPSVMPYQPNGVWAEATFGNKRYQVGQGEDLYRRSLYTYWRRIVGPTMFFDVAKRQTCEVKVARTNTPLHALVTLNDITYVEAARVMAQHIMMRENLTGPDRLAAAFYRATARQPSDQERQILAGRFAELKSWYAAHPEDAAKLLHVGAAPQDQNLDPIEHAAYTGVCSMILNLDEVLNK